jgi:long-chain fatty acid transport protein
MMRTFSSSLLILCLVGCPLLSHAAGWALLGGAAPSAAGLGMAYAGAAARVDDVSVVAANPAGIGYLLGAQWSVGVQVQDLHAEPEIAGVSSSDVRNPVVLPHLYASKQLTDQWSVGVAIISPYAFDRRFDATWVGAQNNHLQIESQSVNPAIAYRVNDALSVGTGLNYQTLKLRSENAGSLYQGKDAALGWNAGAMYELAPYMRLGLAYRSAVRHSLPNDLVLDTPENLTFSVWQRYSDQWEASGEISRYRLSGLRGQHASVQQAAFAYEEAWRFAWGAAYQHNDRWKSRFGLAVERNAADGANLANRLSEDHAVWLALGLQYRVSQGGAVDLGLAVRWPSRAAFENGGSRGEYSLAGHVASVQYSQAY